MKKFLARLSLACAFTALALLYLNGLGMVMERQDNAFRNLRPPQTTWWQPDTLPPYDCAQGALRYRFRPGFQGREWGSSFSINSFGFRGVEFNPAKPAGTRRVLCLGDSCTFGCAGLGDAETYPVLLQNLLNRNRKQGAFEVLNAGMPGFSVYEGLTLYRRLRLAGLRPDWVVIAYGWNDHTGAALGDFWTAQGRRVDGFLRRHSPIYRYGAYCLSRRRSNLPPPRWTLRVNPEGYQRALGELIGSAERDGAQVIVMTAPWEPRLYREDAFPKRYYDLHPAYADLTRETAPKSGAALLDLFALFESKKTADPRALFNDLVHYNKTGAALAAAAVRDAILGAKPARSKPTP